MEKTKIEILDLSHQNKIQLNKNEKLQIIENPT